MCLRRCLNLLGVGVPLLVNWICGPRTVRAIVAWFLLLPFRIVIVGLLQVLIMQLWPV